LTYTIQQLLLQDIFEDLYAGKSARDKGTLYHIRNKYQHRNVSSNVMSCFNHASELMLFTTEAYVVAAACKHLGLGDPHETPQDMPEMSDYQKCKLFVDTVVHVVEMAFHPPDPSNIISATPNGDNYPFCICNVDTLEPMVYCNNRHCPRGRWFHWECIDLAKEDIPDGDWWCSEKCKAARKQKGTKPSDCSIDHKLEYSKAILWLGLADAVRTDAVRKGDGERMMMHWRYDMMNFYEKHHPKYFIFGHRLLTCTGGGASARLGHQLTWNRTVNPSGVAGKNIAMDLQMEHFNREYKGK
jgi:hypothetical protein